MADGRVPNPDEIRMLPEAVERERRKKAAEYAEIKRKQAAVNVSIRKQAIEEVRETIRRMREMDPDYSLTPDEIAAMVDDRVARIKAGR